MKPFFTEDPEQKNIMDIIRESDPELAAPDPINLTLGEAKRIELIRKMKNDTDKIEYMIMLKALIIVLIGISIYHFITYQSILSVITMIIGGLYFFVTRIKLRSATIKLAEYKNNFDKYLWEGFHLKEMRYAAVKFAYLLFFPILCILLVDIIATQAYQLPFYTKILTSLACSTVGWFIFFGDDQAGLESIETDLKALAYM